MQWVNPSETIRITRTRQRCKWKCKLRVQSRRMQIFIWNRRKINQYGFACDFRLGHIWDILISIMQSLIKLVLSYFARGLQNVKGLPPQTGVFMAIRVDKQEICVVWAYKSWMFFHWINHNLVGLSEVTLMKLIDRLSSANFERRWQLRLVNPLEEMLRLVWTSLPIYIMLL